MSYAAATRYPQRIVCLTAETADILHRLGCWDRVVGVSGYTLFPREARQKPKIGGFTTIFTDKVLALEPDLVISFSNLQAETVRELVAKGVRVLAMNQRNLSEMFETILLVGALVGREAAARDLMAEVQDELDRVAALGRALPRHPRVFFEEWPDPLIAGIGWVSEIVELAGGEDIFADLRRAYNAKARAVKADEVLDRDPELIIASWCGKKVRPERIVGRPGWDGMTAVRTGQVQEIRSAYILQPGPALLEGLRQIHALVAAVATADAGGAARYA
ncbi:MAG: cobalamin-binding protein [Chloroflexi bacterium]|nr:cobalamin-binding protein [Chloroflexota bacterium]